MSKKRTTMTEVANKVGISVSMISHIIAGRKPCPKELARALGEATEYPARIWAQLWVSKLHRTALGQAFGARRVTRKQTPAEKREYNRNRRKRLKQEQEW